MESSLIAQVAEAIKHAVQLALPDLPEAMAESALDIAPTQPQFGHYQYNGAMKLAKALQRSPRLIAEEITARIDRSHFSGINVAGPGFINLTLRMELLSQLLTERLDDPRLGIPLAKAEKVILDFSSPNTAKEMHVGHLRSTIIGDSLARLFEFLGHNVLRINHIGDWGTAFGMLIAYIKRSVPNFSSIEAQLDIPTLMQWYRNARELFERDGEFKKESQLAVVALQSGDVEAKRLWEVICDISRKAYQEVYDILGVSLIEKGESSYNSLLPGLVAELEGKGLIATSDGAKCLFIDGFKSREGTPLPLILQKSDGGYNYDTTDLAALKQRVSVDKADRILYVVDIGQATHFEMLFKAAELAGYLDPKKTRVAHIGFGLVLGDDGKKFRSRSGSTEKLVDLLTEAVARAELIVAEKNPDLSLEKRHTIARILAIGAVKYADLACHRTGNYHFSYDRMLRFDGNTAPFLLYSYVRAEAIKRRLGFGEGSSLPKGEINLLHPSEQQLGLQLLQWSEVLDSMANDFLPNKLCDYLYSLAEKFNGFFRDCRVEGTQEQLPRLLLCDLFARTMRLGLYLLGIETVEQM